MAYERERAGVEARRDITARESRVDKHFDSLARYLTAVARLSQVRKTPRRKHDSK